ncbi:hypothetical protein GUJ93_ZPchr0010g8446 [Zizania palustris]|uniref:Uncharacterized protein n=1 Tax=Zizania palustris TaxID=103762 RepID=A0A8J5W8C1_ZIZPA|nr:hypothetical protein GUJ93_ZPchr0010g8446 [Zizania palustris]
MKGLLPKTTTMKAAGDKGKDCNKAPVSCSSCVELQVVSASQVPQRRNQRTRRRLVAVVDLEVDASWEGNKRQMIIPVIHILSPERKEGSILQWFSLCSQYWLFWPPYRVGVLLAFKWNELFVLS